MKNFTIYSIVIASFFYFNTFAQHADRGPANDIAIDTHSGSNGSSDDLAVVSYHVEERINMIFGGRITTYDVSNISLVDRNELGQNNTRVVTVKYGKAKTAAPIVAAQIRMPLEPITLRAAGTFAIKIAATAPKEKVKYVNIDIINTYERILEKGYKSVDMLKRVANGRYFDGDLSTAAKWYTQLFAITSDLDAVFYFRYAKSLEAIGQLDRAHEMMAAFENKNK